MLKVGLVGSGGRFLSVLNALQECSVYVAVYSPDPNIQLAIKGINRFVSFEEFCAWVTSDSVDYVICASYGKYIQSRVFLESKSRWLNLHASHIPHYRGGSPINWAIINGEKSIAVTMLEMTKGLDIGPIVLQSEHFSIEDKNYNEVVEQVNLVSGDLVKKFISSHEKLWSTRINQSLLAGSHYTTRVAKDSEISFRLNSDVEIRRFSLALPDPLPLPFVFYRAQKVEFVEFEILPFDVNGPPGRVAGNIHGHFVIVAANRGIGISKVIVDGNIMQARDIFLVGEDVD